MSISRPVRVPDVRQPRCAGLSALRRREPRGARWRRSRHDRCGSDRVRALPAERDHRREARARHVVPADSLRARHRASRSAGVAVLEDHRLLISVEHFVGETYKYSGAFTIEEVVHHGVHLLDYANLGAKLDNDTEWHVLNPPAFAVRATRDARDRATARVRQSVRHHGRGRRSGEHVRYLDEPRARAVQDRRG